MNWKDQIDDIEIWLSKKGYDVIYSAGVEDCVYMADKTMHINSRCSLETQYYTMLHECGHILIMCGESDWKKEIPHHASAVVDGRIERGKAFKVSLVAEEIEAWRRGKRLGKKYGHYINENKYNTIVTDCVWSYIVHVATPEKKEVTFP